MNYKHCCVIDANQNYKTFVLVKTGSDPLTSQEREEIQHYSLLEGERLVDAAPPTLRPHAGAVGMIRPQWDGKAWTEAATQKEIAAWEAANPDPNAKTLAELRADKLAELSAACNATITAGMDVETSQGKEHFSLQETDQINLSTALSAVQAGAAGYPYRADGQLCRMFTAEEIQTIAQTATVYKLEHTTYYNHIAAWVRRAEAAELAGITYGADLPADLADNMAAILVAVQGGTADV